MPALMNWMDLMVGCAMLLFCDGANGVACVAPAVRFYAVILRIKVKAMRKTIIAIGRGRPVETIFPHIVESRRIENTSGWKEYRITVRT